MARINIVGGPSEMGLLQALFLPRLDGYGDWLGLGFRLQNAPEEWVESAFLEDQRIAVRDVYDTESPAQTRTRIEQNNSSGKFRQEVVITGCDRILKRYEPTSNWNIRGNLSVNGYSVKVHGRYSTHTRKGWFEIWK